MGEGAPEDGRAGGGVVGPEGRGEKGLRGAGRELHLDGWNRDRSSGRSWSGREGARRRAAREAGGGLEDPRGGRGGGGGSRGGRSLRKNNSSLYYWLGYFLLEQGGGKGWVYTHIRGIATKNCTRDMRTDSSIYCFSELMIITSKS